MPSGECADRDYIWQYFKTHASQRLITFNYYILISTLIMSGYFIAMTVIPIMAMALSILLTLFSFVFYKLDLRTRGMIKNAEVALRHLENKTISLVEGEPSAIRIFTYEYNKKAEDKLKKLSIWERTWTYADCFNMVFTSFALIGAIGFVVAILTFPHR